MERIKMDRDFRYIDGNGNLLRSRTEFAVSKMLSFLRQNYQYYVRLKLNDNSFVTIDFKTHDRYIEVVDSEDDIEKFKTVQRKLPEVDIIALGHSKYAAKVDELDSLFFFNSDERQTGSIFIEDPSLAFDYAHVLPLVEKCSVLHGHTSTVMVEIIGTMVNNLVMDFGQAKNLIKETLMAVDHKFFINKKYLDKEDDRHYIVSFDGP